MGVPSGASAKEPVCQCRRRKRHGFNPQVRKVPWRRAWPPTPGLLLESPMDRGAWRATAHRGMKDWGRRKWPGAHSLPNSGSSSGVALVAQGSRTIARQAPLSLGFPRQAYWRGLLFPFPADPPNSGIEPRSAARAGGFFTTEPPAKPHRSRTKSKTTCSSWARGVRGYFS